MVSGVMIGARDKKRAGFVRALESRPILHVHNADVMKSSAISYACRSIVFLRSTGTPYIWSSVEPTVYQIFVEDS